MTIANRIAKLYWDYTMTHGERPAVLRLTWEDEDKLDHWAIMRASKGHRPEGWFGPKPRFMGMEVWLQQHKTEVVG